MHDLGRSTGPWGPDPLFQTKALETGLMYFCCPSVEHDKSTKQTYTLKNSQRMGHGATGRQCKVLLL